jgi:pyruvate dehydrogenase E2 component (dihydrolipoamide acetyltransferase)
MPALGIAQETGKLLQWLKTEGQTVTKGEPIMVVETDKTTVEIEAEASGVLSRVTASVGDEIPVGNVIAIILAPGETAAALAASISSAAVTPAPVVSASPVAKRIAEENGIDLAAIKPAGSRIEKADVLAYLESKNHSAPQRLVAASPKARLAAQQQDIDITSLAGSGPGGAVLYGDVTTAANAKPNARPTTSNAALKPFVAEGEALPTSHVWRLMAERTTQSWTSVPHFYLSKDVHAGRLMNWRERAQKRSTVKVTYTDLLVRLVAAALVAHPRINATWTNGAVHLSNGIHIGLAVAIEDGLVVTVIHNAQDLDIFEIAAQRTALVGRAQSGKLKPDDLSGGTFTISNLGMYGIDSFNAIVNSPQAAILAVGQIASRVVPVDDRPSVQPMMTLTLSCDHRAVDGARGAQFLQSLAEMIEEPLDLLD